MTTSENDVLMWTVVAVAIVLQMILIFFHRKVRLMSERQASIGHIRQQQLAQLLQSGLVGIWTYDVATQTFTRREQDPSKDKTYHIMDFVRHFLPEQVELIGVALTQIVKQEKESVTLELEMRGDVSEKEEGDIRMLQMSVLHKHNGKPTTLLGIMSNVSHIREQQHEAEKQMLRYKTVFNTALSDMIFYDADGQIAEMNKLSEKTFHMTVDEAKLSGISLYDAIGVPKEELDQMPLYHVTGLQNTTEKEGWNCWRKGIRRYEMHLVPAHDNNGQLMGYYASGRKMDEPAAAYHQLRSDIQQTEESAKLIRRYIDNINHVLGVGGARIASYSPYKHTLTLYRGIDEVEMTLTQARCMKFVDTKSERTALHAFDSMDACTDTPMEINVKTTLRKDGQPIYLSLQFIPDHDENGQLTHYFGLCRDQSKMENTRRLLEKESLKAQEVEGLMNTFLHNMSYEIRTPLNAVVGFSELLRQSHTTDDESIFIRQIKDNSSHLLMLINDILFISRLDARMIEINRQPTDFANTFAGHCERAWEDYRKEGVSYLVENPYTQLVVDIDDLNVGRLIEQIVANAAQNTIKGYIKARYEFIVDHLLIAITDSGPGMSKETLSHIFERFKTSSSNGTGLGLPICKELADQMGATIRINSVPDKGTTVWISIPCSVGEMERKPETQPQP